MKVNPSWRFSFGKQKVSQASAIRTHIPHREHRGILTLEDLPGSARFYTNPTMDSIMATTVFTASYHMCQICCFRI